jgi:TatD DNase family protein
MGRAIRTAVIRSARLAAQLVARSTIQPLVDSHCHLADDAFADDAESVISRARAANLTHALCVLAAGDAKEAERAPALLAAWPALRFSVGVHPHQAGHFAGRATDAGALVRSDLARHPSARAIGEIGLDYHYDFAPKAVQHEVFRIQIRLARELDLPIIIHTREAEDDTLAILREESGGTLRGVLHCFTGTRGLAEQGLALGLLVSFAGIVTFPKAAELREIVPTVPDDRLLCETDSPYLAPTPNRGKRNEPAWVVRVAEELARLRGVPIERLDAQVTENFSTLFRP